MQSTGHTGTHFRQPLHSSGTMTTSMPWLKIAPNCSGQWRRHASQLMHSDISIRSGTFCHLGLRSCVSMRSSRVFAAKTLPCRLSPSQLWGGSVAKHQFLSDDWFEVVGKLVDEHGADVPAQANVVVNLVITDTPFGDERQMHMGARDGKGEWG